MLEVTGLQSGYGKALAIDGISLHLDAASGLALLGRNGAGKSTTLKSIMGLIPPWQGDIRFKGEMIGGKPPEHIAHSGIGYVPEERRIFESLSVTENLLTGEKSGSGELRTWTTVRVFELFPEIARRRSAPAGTLSGGERQMLAIGRALMGNPELLLLDEPSEGLAPVVVNRLASVFSTLRTEGIAILISEQNRKLARAVADDLVILETGSIAYSGTFSSLDSDPGIARRFLAI